MFFLYADAGECVEVAWAKHVIGHTVVLPGSSGFVIAGETVFNRMNSGPDV